MEAGGFARQDHVRDVAKSQSMGVDTHLTICLEDIPDSIRLAIDAACKTAGIQSRLLDRTAMLSSDLPA